MFTGIIKHLGEVKNVSETGTSKKICVKVINVPSDVQIGDSVSINGCCLTVTEISDSLFNFDIINETLARTNLNELNVNDLVNVEFSMRVSDYLGGHFVYGHVDFVAYLDKMVSERYTFNIPAEYSKYFTPKGSVCINGISLTVTQASDTTFSVDLIPSTLEHTNLCKLEIGSRVNIEIDIIARYLEKLI